MSKKRLAAVISVIAVVILVYWRWFTPGFISYGDWVHNVPLRVAEYWGRILIWDGSINIGTPLGINAPNNSVIYPIAWLYAFGQQVLGLSVSITSRLAWFVPYLLVSVVSGWMLGWYVSRRTIGAVTGALFFALNVYALLTSVGGQMSVANGYAAGPLVLLAFIYLVKKPGRVSALWLSLAATWQAIYDFRLLYLTALTCILYLIYHWVIERVAFKQVIGVLQYALLAVLGTLLLQSYWIIPAFLSKSGGSMTIPLSNIGTFWIDSLSYSTLNNTLTLNHVWWPTSDSVQHSVWGLSYLVPIIATLGLFDRRSRKISGFFWLLYLLGALLAAGARAPVEGLYEWLFVNVPGFRAFRDPAKMYSLVAWGLTPLISLGVVYLYDRWRGRLGRIVVSTALVVVGGIYVWPVASGSLAGTLNTRTVPETYDRFYTWLDDEIGGTGQRTLWWPALQRFMPYTQDVPAINARQLVDGIWAPFYDPGRGMLAVLDHQYMPWLLRQYGVSRIVLPDDTEDEIYRHYGTQKQFKSRLSQLSGWAIDRSPESRFVVAAAETRDPVFTAGSVVAIGQTNLQDDDLPDLTDNDVLVTGGGSSLPESVRPRVELSELTLESVGDNRATFSFSFRGALKGATIDRSIIGLTMEIDGEPAEISSDGSIISARPNDSDRHTLDVVYQTLPKIDLLRRTLSQPWVDCHPDPTTSAKPTIKDSSLTLTTADHQVCARSQPVAFQAGRYLLAGDDRLPAGTKLTVLGDQMYVPVEFPDGEELPTVFDVSRSGDFMLVLEVPSTGFSQKLTLDAITVTDTGWSVRPSIKQLDQPGEVAPAITQWKRLSPWRYEVVLPSTASDYFLVLNQAYSEGWRLEGVEPTAHFEGDIGLNVWQLSAGDSKAITIAFGSFTPYILGYTISIGAFGLALWQLKRSKR